MGKISLVLGAFVSTLAAFACSSSSGGGGGGGSGGSCAASIGGASSACSSCVESHCGSQISSAESACSDFFGCVCPGGNYNASLLQQCASKAQEGNCASAGQAVGTCQGQNCASQCATGGSSGGGSGSGSGGGANAVFCTSHSQAAGGAVCWVLLIEGLQDQSSAMSTCTGSLGGTVVSACPTAGLVGCCTSTTVTPSTDECFYEGTESSQANFCATGSWTTTIP